MPNYLNYQTTYIITSYKQFIDLFSIILKLDLDQDISEVCAKFQRVPIIAYGLENFERKVKPGSH